MIGNNDVDRGAATAAGAPGPHPCIKQSSVSHHLYTANHHPDREQTYHLHIHTIWHATLYNHPEATHHGE